MLNNKGKQSLRRIHMKKLAIALTAFALIFGLSACTETAEPVQTPDQSSPVVVENTDDNDVPDTQENDSESTDSQSSDSESVEDEKMILSEEDATEAYKLMVERFENESPVDVYTDVMDLLPQMPDHLSSILFAKFDKYLEMWSMNYTDQMYFEDGPMFRLDTSLSIAFDYETDTYDLEKVENPTHKAILESLFSNGFKFIWLEGSPYPFIDYSAFKVLGDQVPEEVMAFILVMSEESDQISSADAGLIISWNELASRTVNTEKAMKLITNEDLYHKLESVYIFYTNTYLLGMSNTPVVGWEDNKMLQEVLDSYEKTLANHSNSELANIIEQYLEALVSLNYTLPYSDQDKFQSIVKMQSEWIDDAVKSLHSHHVH